MNIGGDGGATMAASAAGMMGMNRSPFTVSQWQELEHQALIFKYMMAGLPVPPDLVLPIQKSFDSISPRLFHHPTMGYCSFYGKVDAEPGRCRRTDGKKWRCSKEAYPDSKYCERHMHRGRNRSRKPVESQTMTHSSSSAASLAATGTGAAIAAGTAPAAFHNLTFDVLPNSQSAFSGTRHSHFHLDSIPFGIPNRDYRDPQGLKSEVGEHSFFSGSNQMDAQLHNICVSSTAAAKSSLHNMIQSECSGHQPFFNDAYASADTVRPESQSLRLFFDEWPRTRDSWSGLTDERMDQASFSTTQLSMSILMASPDFSASSCRSPHGQPLS